MSAVDRKQRFRPGMKRILISLLAALAIADIASAQTEWRFTGVERVVAIADIHGAYNAFQRILQQAGVVDNDLAWTGGRSHVVIVGDVLDRGADSRLAMDLIRQLEVEAAAAGGRVHMVLGNHEIMNLAGDLRYVAAGEYAAFASEESLETREAEFRRIADALGDPAQVDAARQRFDTDFPTGYFAHRQAFSADGEYGRWLLEKPVLLVINDVAFVHAGLADAVMGNAGGLNSRVWRELRDFLAARDRLVAASAISRTADLYELPSVAAALLEDNEGGEGLLPGDLRRDAETLQDLGSLSFLSPDGVVWYRGNVACNRLTERDRLAAALGQIGAAQLVIGHTPTRGAVVLSRMNDMLLRIDTGMLNEYYGGRASALIIERGSVEVVYENEAASATPRPQARSRR